MTYCVFGPGTGFSQILKTFRSTFKPVVSDLTKMTSGTVAVMLRFT